MAGMEKIWLGLRVVFEMILGAYFLAYFVILGLPKG